MWKGLAVLVAIGTLFAYFLFNFISNEQFEDSFISQSDKDAKKWAKYYTTDIMGDPVLDLNGVQFGEARKIWNASRLKKEMMENFPNFELIKRYVKSRLKPSPFRKYLLDKIYDIENDYLGGSIDYEEAKYRLNNM